MPREAIPWKDAVCYRANAQLSYSTTNKKKFNKNLIQKTVAFFRKKSIIDYEWSFEMIGAVYFVVILLASILGAIVGLGGGVFIRPIFDTIGYHGMSDIQFFSSSAILSMAVVSTYKKMTDGTAIDKSKVVLISAGALVGGVFGDFALQGVLSMVQEEATAQRIQALCTSMVLLISIVLTAKSSKRYEIKSKGLSFTFGVFLGGIAVFLGIGGGPLNVPLMMIFFGLSIKSAAAYSIVIVFFSHMSRIVTIGWTVGFLDFDLLMLVFIIPAAVIGGLVGARFSKVLTDDVIKKMFIAAISAVILLNIINATLII